jgi:hypothetical protein
MKLRISSSAKEGLYQGSKWLKSQVLCSKEELQELFSVLNPFSIYPLTGIVDGKAVPPESFLAEVAHWTECLQRGQVPTDASLRRCAAAFTKDPEALWLQEVPSKGFLVKIRKPVLQVQAHYFTYSAEDHVFRPMSMGPGSIFWGLQFSYPQIYQSADDGEIREAPLSDLFEQVRKWARAYTRATPFLVDSKRINSPIRLGKSCFSWIHLHPQLIEQKIGVLHES